MATQPTLQWVGTQNFTSSRCNGHSPIAVALHEVDLPISSMDGDHKVKRNAPGNHISYHFAIAGCTIHQYVNVDDTSWSFAPSADLSPWPIAVANPGDPNCYTINIAVSTGVTVSSSARCVWSEDNAYSRDTRACLAKLLCWLSEKYSIPINSENFWRHGDELADLNLAKVLKDANDCLNAADDEAKDCCDDFTYEDCITCRE
jgi:hypothetical protein